MSTKAAIARAEAARLELADTLDALEDKLNVPKRLRAFGARAEASYQKNPVPFIIGGAVATAVAVGLIAWAILSDD